MRSFPLAHLFLVFLLLVGAQPVRASWSHDPYAPNTIPGTASAALFPQAIPDGNGGMYAVLDLYGLGIYLAHIRADGTPDPTWPTPGRLVSTATVFEGVDLALDGFGGIWLMWRRVESVGEIYVSRVLLNGTLAPGVGPEGLQITASFPNSTTAPRMAVSPLTGDLTVAFEHAVGGVNDDIVAVTIRTEPVSIRYTSLVSNTPISERFPRIAINEVGQIGVLYSSYPELWFTSIDYTTGSTIATFRIAESITNVLPGALCGVGGAFYAAYERPLSLGVQMVLSAFNADNSLFTTSVPMLAGLHDQEPLAIVPRSGGRAWLAWREQFSETGPASVAVANIQSLINIATIRTSQQQIGLDVLFPRVVSDGMGGLFLHGHSYPAGGKLAIRMLANGSVPPTWAPAPWSAILAMPTDEALLNEKSLCPTGDGGAFAFGFGSNVYMRLDRWGAYSAEPEQLLVKDVVADQGGRVRLSWVGSYLDAGYPQQVSQYRIWRQVVAAGATDALTVDDAPQNDDPQPGEVRWHTAPSGVAAAWEFIGSQPAAGLTEYSFVASTGQDSSSSGSHANEFMVEAVHLAHGASGITWFSAPATGWSVDNLPPAMPSPFVGTLTTTGTQLTWNANTETDLAGYRLYRGAAATFVPGPSNLVAQTTATSVLDAGSSGYWYKLAAVDARGNVSPYAVLSPAGTLDTPGPRTPTTLEFGLVSANPSRGGAGLRLALPTFGHVRVAVYDVRGRQVRVLEEGVREAGEYALTWDGRDEAGAEVGGGVYFARLATAGRTMTQRMVRLR